MIDFGRFVAEKPHAKPKSGLYLDPKPDVKLADKSVDYSLPLQSVEILVDINHCLCNVTQTLLYRNTQDSYIDAVYCFPIEPKGALHSFEAVMGKHRVIGIVKEKEEAKAEYEKKKSEGATVALAETYQHSKDIIFIKLGNLPPGESIAIKLQCVQEAEVSVNKFWAFMISSKVRPRYMTTFAPSEIGKPPTYKWTFQVELKTVRPIVLAESTTHKLTVLDRAGKNASFVLPQEQRPDQDFQFVYSCEGLNQPKYLATKDGLHGLLSFIPNFCNLEDADAFKARTDWEIQNGIQGQFIFLLDRSGSMSGGLIYKAKQALVLFIRSLPANCFFNIVSFGSEHKKMFPTSVRYSNDSMQTALEQVEAMKADFGGTEIYQPLCAVFQDALLPGYPRNVIVLTDGGVSDTESVLKLVQQQNQFVRSSCIGIGSGASQSLVKGIAERGLGEYSIMSIQEDLKQKIIDILLNLSSPVISDFNLKFDDALFQEVLPNPGIIPYVQKNQPLNFYLKLRRAANDEDQVQFSFMNSYTNEREEATLPLVALLNTDDVGKLFSFKKIRLMQNVLKGKKKQSLMLREWNKDVRKDIIRLSTQAQILSEYTAWLAVFQGDELKARFFAHQQKEIQRQIQMCQKAVRMRRVEKATVQRMLPQAEQKDKHVESKGFFGKMKAAVVSAFGLDMIEQSSLQLERSSMPMQAQSASFDSLMPLPPPPGMPSSAPIAIKPSSFFQSKKEMPMPKELLQQDSCQDYQREYCMQKCQDECFVEEQCCQMEDKQYSMEQAYISINQNSIQPIKNMKQIAQIKRTSAINQIKGETKSIKLEQAKQQPVLSLEQGLQRLISLQLFDGHWEPSPATINILKADLSKHAADIQAVVVTFLVLKWIELHFADRREMRGIVRKAKQWLKNCGKPIDQGWTS